MTRFARIYADRSMVVMPDGTDFVTARDELVESSDDPNVELLEIELRVIRTHGAPKLKAAQSKVICCPTCGESIYFDDVAGVA